MASLHDLEKKDQASTQENIEEVNSGHSLEEEEHRTGKWTAVKQNPKAVVWCVFGVWVIVLTSFENLASSVVLGIPEFRKDFGHPFQDNYILDTIWQSAISGGPVAT